MFREFFSKEKTVRRGEEATVVGMPGYYSLADTLECGQCFRAECVLCEGGDGGDGGYVEYIIPVGDLIIRVGQERLGELIFYGISDEDFEGTVRPYFTLDTDYEAIRRDVLAHTDSEWLMRAADCAKGIAILRQDPWEALFSFIISQNNNIPRIKKIIREMSGAYGVNITLQNKCEKCPANKISGTPCEEKCKNCGICYTFPRAEDVYREPEKMLPSRPGFRYKYLYDAAKKVATGEVSFDMIAAARSYAHTVECLTKIKGVGLKVAACCALFGFGNLEAFPIDVWMKRAIDEYFGGTLDPESLGRYAGIAQQYIFHYIRNLQE